MCTTKIAVSRYDYITVRKAITKVHLYLKQRPVLLHKAHQRCWFIAYKLRLVQYGSQLQYKCTAQTANLNAVKPYMNCDLSRKRLQYNCKCTAEVTVHEQKNCTVNYNLCSMYAVKVCSKRRVMVYGRS